MMSESAQEDYDRCMQEAEEERAEQRAKLFLPVGEKVGGFVVADEGEDAPKLVEEIESLCMNCHENVRRFGISDKHSIAHHRRRASRGCFLLKSLIFARSSSCRSPVSTAISATAKCKLPGRSNYKAPNMS